jgi:hypothetical protein
VVSSDKSFAGFMRSMENKEIKKVHQNLLALFLSFDLPLSHFLSLFLSLYLSSLIVSDIVGSYDEV